MAALTVEALIGYPDRVHAVVPHPITWAGALIDHLERRLNAPDRSPRMRRALGVLTLFAAAGAAAALGATVARLPPPARVAAATLGLAQRSLYAHVTAVLRDLEAGDLAQARRSVGKIIGRDTDELDASGVAAAAIESLAESFNDGVVAPAFWLQLGGLPALYVYKAVNTADSLIGHTEPRWRAYGWASARADDALNLAPARLAGSLIAVAGGRGWRTMLSDAGRHASPNAGWPEAAMAGALGVRLGGPATYDGIRVERPTFGAGPLPGVRDLRRGLHLYLGACGLLWALVAIEARPWRR